MVLLPPRPVNRPSFACLTLGLLFAAAPFSLRAATPQLTWGPGGAGGSGTWDTSTVNWYNGTANVPWINGDSALFAGTAGTVSISGSVTASQVTFATAGYIVQNFFLQSADSGLTVQTDADATISSSIFGPFTSAAFTKSGSGVLTLTDSGPVFFSNVNITGGELRYTGVFGSPAASTPYTLADAAGVALTLSRSTNTIQSLAGGGANGGVVRPNVTSGSLSLSLSGSADASFGGQVQDNGGATLALQKSGTGTQTLTGANTYSGATTVGGGRLVLSGANGSALNTSAVIVNTGGTLQLDNTSAASNKRLAGNVPVTLNGGTFALTANPSTAVTQTVGVLNFSRAATVTVAPAGTASQLVFAGGLARQNNGTVSFSGGGNVTVTGLTNLNGIVGPYATVGGTDWATANAGGSVFAYTGYTSDPVASTGQDNLRLVSAGGTTTALGKAQSLFNSVNLVNNGTAAAVLDLGANQGLALTSGGLLTSGSAGHTIQNGTLTASGNELIVTNQAALTIASTVANGSAASTLTKSGAGTLTLMGANTYTGATVINQGTVQIAADNNLGTGSAVVLNGGGTLQPTAGFTSAKSLQGSGGTMNTAGFNVSFTGGNNTGSITKTGAGILALTGTVANVTVAGGTLRLTNLAAGNAAFITQTSGRLEASGSGVQYLSSLGASSEVSPGAIGQAAALTLGTFIAGGSAPVIDFDLGSGATDSLTVSSNLQLLGSQMLFRFTDLGGTRTGTAYPLLNLPSFSPSISAANFAIDPASAAAGYQGTFNLMNNTLSVTFTAVPEPCLPLWLLGAGVLWGIRRLHRSRRSVKGVS